MEKKPPRGIILLMLAILVANGYDLTMHQWLPSVQARCCMTRLTFSFTNNVKRCYELILGNLIWSFTEHQFHPILEIGLASSFKRAALKVCELEVLDFQKPVVCKICWRDCLLSWEILFIVLPSAIVNLID